ncbi:hypothetical protein J2754_000488 [Halarchaeum solikamskense]|uniref:DUF5518 domain-containing protein n=1 Tax=Halarchaeum nitratireducens TaxID=489913 RepID=UPI001B3AB0E7|nr:DUF5518 domain-containing protein [Halarchaeum solikamskense]MBP2250191.1 hypothetical protein [Halarchaeum solikamskense]
MSLRSRLRALADERYRVALLLGLASLPVTIALNWIYAPEPVSATPLAVACLGAGGLSARRAASGRRAGEVAALAGSAPVLAVNAWRTFAEWAGYAPLVTRLGAPLAAVVALGAALLTVVILLTVLLVVGHALGRAGAWIVERGSGVSRA